VTVINEEPRRGPGEQADETSGRRARRREVRTEAVLDVASRIVAREGLEGLTLGKVAGELDLVGPALYRYFASKDALVAALQRRAIGVVLEQLRSRAAELALRSPLSALRSPLPLPHSGEGGWGDGGGEGPKGPGTLCSLHTHPPKGPYSRWIRRHHLVHHHRNPRMNHGVTSPLWDLVAGTEIPLETIKIPRHMAPAWLVDPVTRAVRPEHAADYALVGGKKAVVDEGPSAPATEPQAAASSA
jgi:AcrR family transcriptional regulator